MDLTAEQSLTKITFQLIKTQPFYGNVLLRLDSASPTEAIETAAASPFRIIYNPKFIESLAEDEANFIWLHELYHIILGHGFRCGQRNPKIWNIAADFLVNLYIKRDIELYSSHKISLSIPASALMSDEKSIGGKTTEQLYDDLFSQYQAQGGDEIPFGSFTFKVGDSSYTGDVLNEDLLEKLMGEAMSSEEAAARLKDLLASVSTLWGNSKGALMRDVKDLIGTQIPWYRFIRRWLTARLDDEESFESPNKNFLWKKKILPGKSYSDGLLEDVIVAIDTSGSITDAMLEDALYQVWSLTNDFEMTGRVIYWDAGVQADYELKDVSSVVKCKPMGGGGTVIDPVFDYINKTHKSTKLIIVITDGYWAEQTVRPRAPILWVVFGNPMDDIEHMERHGIVLKY